MGPTLGPHKLGPQKMGPQIGSILIKTDLQNWVHMHSSGNSEVGYTADRSEGC